MNVQARQVLSAFDGDGCMIYLYPNITNIYIYELSRNLLDNCFDNSLPKEGHLVIVIVIFLLDISVQGGKVHEVIPM